MLIYMYTHMHEIIYVQRPGHCCTTGCYGDHTVLCDNIALESKFPIDIVDY